MITIQQFTEICHYTQQYLNKTVLNSIQTWVKQFPRAANHRWQHTLNVLKNADKILAGENLDQEMCDLVRVSAVMHDISMFTCDHSIHGHISAEIAKEYLTEQNFPTSFVNHVARAIEEHGVDLDDYSPQDINKQFSLAGKILLEADILDKLGATPITSSLTEYGKKDLLPFECLAELKNGSAIIKAQYFKEYIWTDTAKKLRDERYAFFLAFVAQLSDEVFEQSMPY